MKIDDPKSPIQITKLLVQQPAMTNITKIVQRQSNNICHVNLIPIHEQVIYSREYPRAISPLPRVIPFNSEIKYILELRKYSRLCKNDNNSSLSEVLASRVMVLFQEMLKIIFNVLYFLIKWDLIIKLVNFLF